MRLEPLLTRLIASVPVAYPLAREAIGLADRIRVARIARSPEPVVVVYQQGRVGSTSVYNALLRSDLDWPVLHLHTLSAAEADRRIDAARDAGRIAPRNLFLSRRLAPVFEAPAAAGGAGEKWRILSIFRDPVAILVSLTMMGGRHGKRPDETDAAFAQRLAARLAEDDPAGYEIVRWMDSTLAAETGIDPYATPFDHDRGFTTCRAPGRRLVLMKFERMAEVLPDAALALLDRRPGGLEIRHENIHRDRSADATAAYVRDHLALPHDWCARLYDTRFARHFYTEDERARMIARWTGAARAD